jgi:hypothetical protein
MFLHSTSQSSCKCGISKFCNSCFIFKALHIPTHYQWFILFPRDCPYMFSSYFSKYFRISSYFDLIKHLISP